MTKKTEIHCHYTKKYSFIFENSSIFIPCKINDTMHAVLYDTDELQFDFCEQIPGNIEFPQTYKTIEVRTILQGVTMKKGLNYYNIESDFFNFKQYVGNLISLSNDTVTPVCMPKNNITRFRLGINAFPKWGDVMCLNFSDTSITLLSPNISFFDTENMYDTTGFIPLKSMFTCQGLSIWLTVDSIEYEFLFSTSYKGFLSLPQYQPHQKENDVPLVRLRKKKVENVIDTLINQYTNTIKINDNNIIAGNIFYIKNTSLRPTLGMAFISQYDWIIDMNGKGNVYIKKINDGEYKEDFQNYYQVNIVDTVLQISLLPVGETEYQLFSIIDSVNGEKVNMENICRMRELLNRENGFKENKLVILPPRETVFLDK